MSALPIRSPLPGIFYRRPAPDAAPFKEDGAAVAAADVVGLIEVMKSFHEVPAGIAGSSITFLIDNEEPVMAGQVIAEVLP
jgi:acetyl-CoA carboxylase biotin carboxyl carrier protein